MAFTQDGRLISIDTPLGKDALLLQGFTGVEGISRLFRFQLDLLSEDAEILAKKIIGQRVTIAVALADGSPRYINGFVRSFAQSETDPRLTRYRAEVVPWLWFLTRTADCRIFQNMTVPDIIEKIFTDLGFTDFKNKLQGSFEPREYCVQYRETDFNFVSRLMEQYGIYYFFEHDKATHTLALADSPEAHQPCPNQARARCELTGSGSGEEDLVTAWHMEQELRPGKYALTDYNFETPSTQLLASVQSTIEVGGNSQYEIYDYPGEYLKKPHGEDLAKLRMEEEEAAYLVVSGTSTCRGFLSGYRFALVDHYRRDVNAAYVLTEVRHLASAGGAYTTGAGSNVLESYSNQFTCTPHTVPFRPPRVTPTPFVQGVQTAVVVGPAGEEIHTDKYGRVKVQFHWDREGKYNENSSCWIRVSQPWAGKNWGGIWTPRIGQEVIVDFLEGDPDRPLITGRTYNAEEMPPYELPKYQTVSTTKSHSSKGGGGFNEIRFEDKKDKEQVFIHSQKRMDVRVRQSFYETCGGTRQICIGGSLAVTVGGDTDIHLKGAEFEGIDGKLNQGIKGDVVCDFQSNDATVVKTKYELNAQQITIEALQQITLKVGSSFVVIDLTGVTIQGPLVKINSGGAATGTGPASIDDPLDCEGADTGEPGFLDRPRSGGGHGRRHRTLPGQHGPNVTRDAAGNYHVGNLTIDGSNPNPTLADGTPMFKPPDNRTFPQAALNDIAMMGTTAEGRRVLNDINTSGHTVTIQPRTATDRNATTSGPQKTPGDATIQYNPAQWDPGVGTCTTPPCSPATADVPSDVILFHEMGHADHVTNGTFDVTGRGDNFDNNDDFAVIGPPSPPAAAPGPENKYRDERDVHRRNDHHDL